MPRARSTFDHERLRAQLKASPDQAEFAEYLEFYGLNNAAQHSSEILTTMIRGREERIVIQTFAPEQPRAWAFFHHGYYDHVGLFRHVFDYLLKHGVGIHAIDNLGHGLSTGERATIPSFDDYVEVVAAVDRHLDQKDMHFIGQSMGGALTLEYLERHPERRTRELVLFAPLVRPYAWWINRIYFNIAKRLIEERPRTITSNASNAEFLHLQHNDPLQARVLPVQWVQAMVNWFEVFERYPSSTRAPRIIQGHQDRTIDWRHSVKILSDRYPQSSWLHIPEASHHLSNESDAIRAQIFGWLDENCNWVEHTS